jgi:uncharacterized protein YdeI (YjbR/CyaY-like superfamily)
MVKLVPTDIRFFTSAAALRDWLAEHHATADELWLGYRPKGSGEPSLTWEEAVDEALCFGWIDSVRIRVDGGSAQRLTPRRPRSVWSLRNVGRVEALRAEGRMHEAGEAAFARRQPERTGINSFEGDAAAFEAAHEAAFRNDEVAWRHWETQPPGYRRAAIHWVVSAKRPETRDRRIEALIAHCRRGERLPQLTSPGRATRTGEEITPPG